MRTLLLDTGPLGLVVHRNRLEREPIIRWLRLLISDGVQVRIPGICDYELRRELIRINSFASLRALDELVRTTDYLSISQEVTHKAAELWADARKSGRPSARDDSLDGDMLLCAHALIDCGGDCIIATTNPGHLTRYAAAMLWETITLSDLASD